MENTHMMFRFTVFWEEIILITDEGQITDFTLIQEIARGKRPRAIWSGGGPAGVQRELGVLRALSSQEKVSEGQILLVVTWRQRPAHSRRAAGALDRPVEDQQGLVEAAIV